MTPLRWFQGLYVAVFGVVLVLFFIAPNHLRLPFTAIGVMLALYGLCLLMNLFGMTSEVAAKAGKSRFSPPIFGDVRVVRGAGVVFLLGGVAFALQALSASDF